MAGTTTTTLVRGHIDGSLNPQVAYEVNFTADASNAAFVNGSVPSNVAGLIDDIGIIFDGTTPPNTVTISITDGYGRVVYSASSITATQAKGLVDVPVPIVNGLSIALSANTTNSAKVKIIVFMV